MFDESPLFIESPVAAEPEKHCDYAPEPKESIDDRLDNFAGSLLYSAFHYPRLFAFAWITGITALAVTVSNAYPCNHSPPARCYL